MKQPDIHIEFDINHPGEQCNYDQLELVDKGSSIDSHVIQCEESMINVEKHFSKDQLLIMFGREKLFSNQQLQIASSDDILAEGGDKEEQKFNDYNERQRDE